ncbi:hypothetical protein EON66_05995 [archaeon]|nr:MAG: hypothetical protein EON66_05995 [archaeon]
MAAAGLTAGAAALCFLARHTTVLNGVSVSSCAHTWCGQYENGSSLPCAHDPAMKEARRGGERERGTHRRPRRCSLGAPRVHVAPDPHNSHPAELQVEPKKEN